MGGTLHAACGSRSPGVCVMGILRFDLWYVDSSSHYQTVYLLLRSRLTVKSHLYSQLHSSHPKAQGNCGGPAGGLRVSTHTPVSKLYQGRLDGER